MNTLLPIFNSMRPRQWYKNLLIFLPLIYTSNIFNLIFLFKTMIAFIVFCLAAGSAAIIDDLFDKDSDKKNPIRKDRPIASEKISLNRVEFSLVVIVVGVIFSSFFLSNYFGILVLIYFFVMTFYSTSLKKIFIVDAVSLAVALTIVVLSGGAVINENIPPWVIILTFLIGVLAAFARTKAEISVLGPDAGFYKQSYKSYNLGLLNNWISMLSFVIFCLYVVAAVSGDTSVRIGSSRIIYTIPFVLFGIFRFLYLVQKDIFVSIEDDVLADLQFISAIILWFLASIALIYF